LANREGSYKFAFDNPNGQMSRIIYFLFLLVPLVSIAQDDTGELKNALAAYNAEDYKSAIITFQNLEKKGYASDELFFNLASACFKNDRLAEAVLYYEKALKLNPRHQESKTNLEIVNNLRDSEISAIPDFFLMQWWWIFYSFCSSSVWLVLSIIVLIAALYFFYRRLFISKGLKSSLYCLCFFGLSILSLLASRSRYSDMFKTKYLVNIEATSLHAGPNEQSKVVMEITAGEKLQIKDQLGDWYQVFLINKEQGWINSNVVKGI